MKKYWIPLIVSMGIALVLWVGVRIGESRMMNALPQYQPEHGFDALDERGGISSSEASAKLVYLFDLLRDHYVDTLNLKQLVEDALPTVVEELDPHSLYIPAQDLDGINEQLEGSFSGVGIQFNIQNDTIMVIQVVSGGPSEKVGLMPGDRIVTVDDSLFVGKTINNDKVTYH